jgi:hypothetical protein
MWFPLFTGMFVCFCDALLATPIDLQIWKFQNMFLLMVPRDDFLRKNVPFQHNLFLVHIGTKFWCLYSIPMFSGTSNQIVQFWKVPDEESCQFSVFKNPCPHFCHFQHNFLVIISWRWFPVIFVIALFTVFSKERT